MDLEHLTRHQTLLLALLISFVTSIATGIVTVSLINQAPPSVTRVVNQIVERTVETVAPQGQGAAAGTATTVVVKEDDLAAQSIDSVRKSMVRITQRGGEELIARGVIINDKGVALTDRTALAASNASVFDAVLFSGERVPAVLRATPSEGTFAVLDIVVGTSTGFSPATLGNSSGLKLGQSVIRIGGSGADRVGVGVIASLPSSESEGADRTIEASIESTTPGSILTNLFGEIIGITTSASLVHGTTFYTVPSLATNP